MPLTGCLLSRWTRRYICVIPAPCLLPQAAPAGALLRRRRSWHLFLGQADCGAVAILVANKKSTFSLADARTALAIIEDEATTRAKTRKIPAQQLLVVTRSSIAPAAAAFFGGLRNRHPDSSLDVALVRWEHLERLVEDSGVGQHLSRTIASGGTTNPSREQAEFRLPTWLVEEREKALLTGRSQLFDLQAPFRPSGDQPAAIEALVRGVAQGKRYQTLLGATGTVGSSS